ncbi:hypothetical protein GCM10010112_21920 [Actinoplanes lobatus]|uniref:Uncharacterized protein n=1 Tax=Actinoplanes lobatus TaxID=113568 RepID=A0A7W7HPQ5_9ACTN|nr:hypothetical protein [Actinoplanes lobatus]MBB4754446.1 hypothetical protein [Actinoplanes lobatus]GGN63061.1 hypothetical protein GCM10010112_21920 [Actinoplanes lobatus]GIE40474.1 hypothetical protein Alo02nite_33720 [Actinoplanes lobatus]
MSPQNFHLDGDGPTDREEPWPVPGRSPLLILVVIFLSVLAVVLGGLAVAALAEGSRIAAAVCAWGALLFGHVAGLSVYLRWRPLRQRARTPRIDGTSDGAGVSFRYSAWGYYWSTTVVLFAVGALAPIIAAGFSNGILGWLISIAIALTGLLLIALYGLMLARAPGKLILTPQGLHHRGLTFEQYAPWSAVLLVAPATVNRARSVMVHLEPSAEVRVRNVVPARFGVREQALLPDIVVRDPWLLADPMLVYRTVRHYQEHPEHRGELSGEAALERIAQRRFPTA